jgi:hypothetical protein
MLPSGQLGRITSGSFPIHYTALTYSKTYANLLNAMGSFQPGGGPGSVNYLVRSGLGAKISPGENQFGGVMRLLKGAPTGGLGARFFWFDSTISTYYISKTPSWGVTLVGATSNGGNPAYGFVDWEFDAPPGIQHGAIGVLRLKFVPEPQSGLVLFAGAGLLSALYRRRAR